jgi:hypothetical protein
LLAKIPAKVAALTMASWPLHFNRTLVVQNKSSLLLKIIFKITKNINTIYKYYKEKLFLKVIKMPSLIA